LRCLEPLFSPSPDAVLFDSMVEKSFALEQQQALAERRIPYRKPWIGAVHVPFETPDSWDPVKHPRRIFRSAAWQDSLPHCRGLIALSNHLAEGVRAELPSVPVLALHHPAEPPEVCFDFEAYMASGQPIVQIGWWLRRLTSIHWLPAAKKRKHIVVAQVGPNVRRYFEAIEREREKDGAPPLEQWSAQMVPHLSSQDYDLLLSRSVVFLHLYASSANNTVIECLVRRTPLLVNPLPAVREYLGSDYPFYFETLEEAAAKASDPGQVLAAHRYLAEKDLAFLSGETFCRRLAESPLYQSLPGPPAT
jgi:hypothetical protein